MDDIVLIWKGTGFLPGIPAKDLTAEEVEEFGKEFLLKSGLYEEKSEQEKKPNKSLNPKPENK